MSAAEGQRPRQLIKGIADCLWGLVMEDSAEEMTILIICLFVYIFMGKVVHFAQVRRYKRVHKESPSPIPVLLPPRVPSRRQSMY